MHILLVEDEEPKQRHISAYVREIVSDLELEVARSVRSALDKLNARVPNLIILDMSLPTFDIGGSEGGGRPQGFGGLELIRMMELEEIECPVVILTGYEAFTKAGGQVTLDSLGVELAASHPNVFRGILHYNSAYGDWQIRLSSILSELGVG
jgi:CheY-like chemotaxis protein